MAPDPRLATGSLAAMRPELIPLWDIAKNGDLTPRDVLNASTIKVHWKCPNGPDHEFTKAPSVMHGCPACHGRQVSVTNSLANLNPDALPYWDHAKNGDLTPDQVVNGSGRPLHWKCPVAPDHQWTKAPSAYAGCPYCSGRRPSSTHNLALARPELVALWDTAANGGLRAQDVLPRSTTPAHWRCDAGPDHQWVRSPATTFGCPYCTGNDVSITNCLATRHPETAAEWHPTKNDTLTPADVRYATNKKVWWQCPDGHDYLMAVADRTGEQRRRCTECVRLHGRKFRIKNPLATHRPDVLPYWDHEANGALTPMDVSTSDQRTAYWRCPNGPDHTWMRPVAEMRKPRCPYCRNKWVSITNSLATVEPVLATEWHPTKNGDLTPNDVLPGSGRPVWWRCHEEGHAFEATPNRRTNPNYRSRCSVCIAESGVDRSSVPPPPSAKGTGKKVADYPAAAARWAFELNETMDLSATLAVCTDEAWWRCPVSPTHVWQRPIRSMCRPEGPRSCPFCTGRVVGSDNTLAVLCPEVAAQWHPTRNGPVTPEAVTLVDAPPVWWKCDVADDHEWRAKVYSRAVTGSGCPACSGHQLSTTNRLDLNYPVIASEFDSLRNGTTPEKVKYGAPARFWWTCRHCSHQWQTRVEKRTRSGQGCPECAVYNVSKEELFLAHEIAAFLPVDFTVARVRDATGKAWRVDIAIPAERLIVEYDGSYWHAGRMEKDAEKTAALIAAGWTVLRVREQPLPDLDDVWSVHCRPERYVETAAVVINALAGYDLIDRTTAQTYVEGRALVRREAAMEAIEARATKRSARRRAMAERAAA